MYKKFIIAKAFLLFITFIFYNNINAQQGFNQSPLYINQNEQKLGFIWLKINNIYNPESLRNRCNEVTLAREVEIKNKFLFLIIMVEYKGYCSDLCVIPFDTYKDMSIIEKILPIKTVDKLVTIKLFELALPIDITDATCDHYYVSNLNKIGAQWQISAKIVNTETLEIKGKISRNVKSSLLKGVQFDFDYSGIECNSKSYSNQDILLEYIHP